MVSSIEMTRIYDENKNRKENCERTYQNLIVYVVLCSDLVARCRVGCCGCRCAICFTVKKKIILFYHSNSNKEITTTINNVDRKRNQRIRIQIYAGLIFQGRNKLVDSQNCVSRKRKSRFQQQFCIQHLDMVFTTYISSLFFPYPINVTFFSFFCLFGDANSYNSKAFNFSLKFFCIIHLDFRCQ